MQNWKDEILVKTLISLIQADGVIAPEETEILAQVLVRLDLKPEEQALVGHWLKEKQCVSPKELNKAFQTQEERDVLIRLLLEVASADSVIAHSELRLLNQLVTDIKNGPERSGVAVLVEQQSAQQ